MLVLAWLILLGALLLQAQELNFLKGHTEFGGIRSMLESYMQKKAFELLDQREKEIAKLTTSEAVQARRRYVRDHIIRALGGLPERTPLNARVVGALQRDGYHIEKIIFESQPKFFVTANLYLPATGQPPYPGILYPLGHEAGAKANPVWQQMLATLARRGFVALAWDPIGQGERLQFYDEDWGDSKLRASTTEHTVLGTQCLLIGDDVARYTIWDGMRALDYLLSRKEVDPKRIGCTGNSGGGTHTAYLSALDDRIHVAAPSCYINSWRWLLKTIGPQDAEQNFPHWLRNGLDFPDFLYAFAPKPYLVLSAIQDFFAIDGARDTFSEAKRVYAAIGAGEKLDMVEADDGHGYTKPRREAAYNWFSRWLKGIEDREPEREIAPATADELRCTETGQVATSVGGESVFTLNRKRAAILKAKRVFERDEVLRFAREMSGFEHIQSTVPFRSYGTIPRSGYWIEKIIYHSEPDILVPALLYVPEGGPAKKPAVIFADGRGKAASADDLDRIVRAGAMVLSIDARGFGETEREPDNSDFSRYFGDHDSAMTAILMARTLTGMRALDITRGVDLLAARADVDVARLFAIGRRAASVPMLYAAAFDARLKRTALEGMLASYQSVVDRRIHRGVFEHIVPGALKQFDLPDLVKAIAPRQVWVINAANPLGQPVLVRELQDAYGNMAKTGELANYYDELLRK